MKARIKARLLAPSDRMLFGPRSNHSIFSRKFEIELSLRQIASLIEYQYLEIGPLLLEKAEGTRIILRKEVLFISVDGYLPSLKKRLLRSLEKDGWELDNKALEIYLMNS